MKVTFLKLGKYALVFVSSVFILCMLLVGVAKIPKESVKAKMQESADYLCEKKVYFSIFENVNSTKIDRYADAILLNIAYSYESDNPLESVMWSKFYFDNGVAANKSLKAAAYNDHTGNEQYLRYWHGSNVIVKPLHLILNVKQIYILSGVVLMLLLTYLIFILAKNRYILPIIAIVAGLGLTSAWYITLSLEYLWMFLIMLIVSIIAVKMTIKQKDEHMGILFLISGVVSCFFDFFTTETVTLTVPLILVMWIRLSRGVDNYKKEWILMGKIILLWGIGYVGMWLMKWLIAALVLHTNVMQYVNSHVEERIVGSDIIGYFKHMYVGLKDNFLCLIPFCFGKVGKWIGSVLILGTLYFAKINSKKEINNKIVWIYFAIGVIPLIRFIVISNHSIHHSFFTFRAQIVFVMAIVFILGEIIDRRKVIRGNVKRRTVRTNDSDALS